MDERPSTYCKIGRCSTSCSIVSYIFYFYEQPISSLLHAKWNYLRYHRSSIKYLLLTLNWQHIQNYWFLFQVHIDFREKVAGMWRHLNKYLFCTRGIIPRVCFHEAPRLIWQRGQILSYYWTCDTSMIIWWFSRSPNMSS